MIETNAAIRSGAEFRHIFFVPVDIRSTTPPVDKHIQHSGLSVLLCSNRTLKCAGQVSGPADSFAVQTIGACNSDVIDLRLLRETSSHRIIALDNNWCFTIMVLYSIVHFKQHAGSLCKDFITFCCPSLLEKYLALQQKSPSSGHNTLGG